MRILSNFALFICAKTPSVPEQGPVFYVYRFPIAFQADSQQSPERHPEGFPPPLAGPQLSFG